MMEISSLPAREIASLTCAQCDSYLSISPITIDPKSGAYRCGRCYRNPKDGHSHSITRATVCETLLNLVIFPCRYEKNGCAKKFLFDQACQHENRCDFKPVPCHVPGCTDFLLKNLHRHFEDHHKDLMLFDRETEIFGDLKCKDRRIFLIDLKDDKHLIMLIYLVKNENEGVIRLTDLKNSDPVRYKIKATTCDSSSNILVLDQVDKVDFRSIQNVMKTDRLKFHLEITNTGNFRTQSRPLSVESSKKRRNSLLNELECFVCSEFMMAPIFSCKIGHNLCQLCRSKIAKCPICRAPYEGTRNFALESLSQILEYPCKNKSGGCDFYGTHDTIRRHEMACDGKMVACPLRHDCPWTGSLTSVCDHLQIPHGFSSFYKIDDLICFKGVNSVGKDGNVFVLGLNSFGDVFKVEVRVVALDSVICWGVAHLGQGRDEAPKYRFVIDFIDVDGMGRKLTVDGLCQGCEGCDIDLKYALRVPFSLLEPFFVDGNRRLCYKINVKTLTERGAT